MTLPDSGIFTDTSTTNGQAKQAQDDILEEVRTIKTGSAGALQASNNLADVADAPTALGNLGGEPADADILKADTADMLQAVYGDEAQTYTGTDLSGLTVTRNHISWTLTASSAFSANFTLPSGWTGTLVFHVYPDGNDLALSTSFKSVDAYSDPDAAAGEIRIVVEVFNSRMTIVSLQNVAA